MGVSYIICAAGHGSRTRVVDPKTPKPFLKINGKTLLEWSLQSLPIQQDDQVVVVLLREHESWVRSFRLDGVEVHFLDKVTRGQAETAHKVRHLLRHKKAVIFNSDTFFIQKDLHFFMNNDQVDGLIPCSRQSGSEWSFCRVEQEGDLYRATEVVEKKRISDFCSVGFYYFRNCEDFFSSVDAVLSELGERSASTELYVAPFYQSLIQAGKKIYAPLTTEFKPMGSVEQIEKYWGITLPQLQQMQS